MSVLERSSYSFILLVHGVHGRYWEHEEGAYLKRFGQIIRSPSSGGIKMMHAECNETKYCRTDLHRGSTRRKGIGKRATLAEDEAESTQAYICFHSAAAGVNCDFESNCGLKRSENFNCQPVTHAINGATRGPMGVVHSNRDFLVNIALYRWALTSTIHIKSGFQAARSHGYEDFADSLYSFHQQSAL